MLSAKGVMSIIPDYPSYMAKQTKHNTAAISTEQAASVQSLRLGKLRQLNPTGGPDWILKL